MPQTSPRPRPPARRATRLGRRGFRCPGQAGSWISFSRAWFGRADPAALARLHSLSGPGEDFVALLWSRNRAEVQALLLRILRAIGAGHVEEARRGLHTLRGGMGFFGAHRLDRLARMLSARLESHGPEASLALLVVLLREADRLIEHLDRLMAQAPWRGDRA